MEGYTLTQKETSTENVDTLCEAKTIEIKENEYIIYSGNPINQFNEFTAVANQLKDDIVALYISDSLKTALEVEVGDKVKVTANNKELTLEVRVDTNLVGDISYVPTFDKTIDTKSLFDTSRFSIANLKRV